MGLPTINISPHMEQTKTSTNLINITELFKTSWETTKDRLKNYWLAALALIGITIISLIAASFLGGLAYYFSNYNTGIFIGIIGIILLTFAAIVIWFWWNILVLEIISGQDKPNFSTAAARTKPLIWPLFLVQLIILFIVGGTTVFLFLPLFYLFIPLMFVVMVFYFETSRGVNIFYRTLDLVNGVWWATLGRISLLWLVGYIVQLFISSIFNGNLAFLLSLAFNLIWAPFAITYLYHLYQSLANLNPADKNKPTKHSSWLILAGVGWIINIIATISIVNFLNTNPQIKQAIQQGIKLQQELQKPETQNLLNEFSKQPTHNQPDLEQIQELFKQEKFNSNNIDSTLKELNLNKN